MNLTLPFLALMAYVLSKHKERHIEVPVPHWTDPGYRKVPIPVPDWVPDALIPDVLRPSSSTPPPALAKPWPVANSVAPAFPGPQWEYDSPPPKVVQARATQLLPKLWARGKGAHAVEKTGGRWIAYQAATVRSGKRGVVAFRLRGDGTIKASPSAQPPSMSTPPVIRIPDALPGEVIRASFPADAPKVVSPKTSLPTLRKGAGIKPKPPNEHVAIVQRKIGITDDGRFGSGTERAVIAFQRARGLTPDGIVGPKTWTALVT